MRTGRPRTVEHEAVAELITKTLPRKPKAATHWSNACHRPRKRELPKARFMACCNSSVCSPIVGAASNSRPILFSREAARRGRALSQSAFRCFLWGSATSRVSTASWHDHPLRPQCARRRNHHSIQTPPSPGAPRLPASHRSKCAGPTGHRQLRHPQASKGQGLARQPVALAHSLHAKLHPLVQPDRTLFRAHQPTRHSLWLLRFHRRPVKKIHRFVRTKNANSQPFMWTANCRFHPPETCATLTADFRNRTLAKAESPPCTGRLNITRPDG